MSRLPADKQRWLFTRLLAIVLILAAAGARADGPSAIRIDRVWAGSSAAFDALGAPGGRVYVGYYDAERYLTVAQVDTRSGAIQRVRLASRFEGWDAHNEIVLALDQRGLLHVAGNMHGTPLVYARTAAADDFTSLRLQPMVGTDESRTTYPEFFTLPGGDLAFSYRSGGSGDGREILNRFDGTGWSRLLPQALFAADPGGPKVSAYHTGYRPGPDGLMHVAWVWRRTPDARTNFHVGYARSADMTTWQTSDGRPQPLPITPSRSEVVDAVGESAGLFNSLKLGFDGDGQPLISYLKFDADGNTQLYHARPRSDGRWQIEAATRWSYRWDFQGVGTLPVDVGFSGVRLEQGRLMEDYNHVRYGRGTLELDPLTLVSLAPTSRPAAAAVRSGPASAASGPSHQVDPYFVNTRPVRQRTASYVAIRWRSLGVDNHDRPRTCESSGLESGCSMTSVLELVRP